jgi:hypothetical protein
MDEAHRFSMGNGYNATDPDSFRQLVATTMNELVVRAANAPSGAKTFATKEAIFNESQTTYSLVQCIPDLSRSGCNSCLQALVANVAVCCGGQLGGTFMDPSCNLRYEIYLFYQKQAVVELAPTPVLFPAPAPGDQGTRPKGKVKTCYTLFLPCFKHNFQQLYCLGNWLRPVLFVIFSKFSLF